MEKSLDQKTFGMLPTAPFLSSKWAHEAFSCDPELIGICIAVWGITCGVLLLTAFDPILKSLGHRRTFIMLTSCFVPSFLLFPINGTRTQNKGTDFVLWVLGIVQMLCLTGRYDVIWYATASLRTWRGLPR